MIYLNLADLASIRRRQEIHAAEIKRKQDERLIQCSAEHCTEDGCEKCAGYEPIGGEP